MGSIGGAFVAAILIAMVKAFCIGVGTVDVFGAPFPLSKLTLVAEFLVMAVVLVGGRRACSASRRRAVRAAAEIEAPLRPCRASGARPASSRCSALALPLLAGRRPTRSC